MNDLDPNQSYGDSPEPYEPTEEEIAQMRASTNEEREAVDALILRECTVRWQKVAKIVGDLLKEFDATYGHLPISFVQARMDELEDLGKVVIAGDVWAMRYSEIRLSGGSISGPDRPREGDPVEPAA